MKGKLIWSIFWALVVVFAISASLMFIPSEGRVNPFIGFPVLAVLGVILIILTIKSKVAGMLRKFLLLTGASTVGFPVFAILHNIVGGLLNIEEPVFFVLATLVCPVSFLVGAVGTVILAIKNKDSTRATEGGRP